MCKHRLHSKEAEVWDGDKFCCERANVFARKNVAVIGYVDPFRLKICVFVTLRHQQIVCRVANARNERFHSNSVGE